MNGLPSVPKIQTTHKRLTDFYDYLKGDRGAKRKNTRNVPPTTKQLKHAENRAWSQMAQWLTEKDETKTLDEALVRIMKGGTFWTNALYMYADENYYNNDGTIGTGNNNNKGKGKGKGQQTWGQPPPPNFNPNYKGNNPWPGNGKGNKGRGKGKGNKGGRGRGNNWNNGMVQWNNGWYNQYKPGTTDQSGATWGNRRVWAPPDAQGNVKAVCKKHHLHGQCPGNCGRDHTHCPNRKPDGSWCGGRHAAYSCPHANSPQ